jgi:hypothetical protein
MHVRYMEFSDIYDRVGIFFFFFFVNTLRDSSGRETLHGPDRMRVIEGATVEEAVVQAVRSADPELDLVGDDTEAAPMWGEGYGSE